jgi:hypothetical protein
MSACALASTSRREDLLGAAHRELGDLLAQLLPRGLDFLLDLGLRGGDDAVALVLACDFDSSMRWFAVFSAAATSSCARARASRISASVCFCASASEERPRSASARPSAICFWRVSIARMSGGHTNFTDVNQMKDEQRLRRHR